MQIGITILLMMIIGAIIGGFTNFLAIKMLFRPYKTLYIGKWRVPFTPGLIPKRRDELAKQMGKLVVNHLLTPKSIQQKFLNETFQKEMTAVVEKELNNFLATEMTPAELMEKLGVTDGQAKLEAQLDVAMEEKYEAIMNGYRNKPLHFLLSEDLKQKAEAKIPEITAFILKKGLDYFSSIEGKWQIQRMADDFLKERSGMLGGMLQMFIGNSKIGDKIQPELIKFLRNEATAEIVNSLIKKEWDKLLEWEVKKFEEQFNKEDIIRTIKELVRKVLNVEGIFKTPLGELTASKRDEISTTLATKGVQLFGEWLASRIDVLMERLRLQEIVQQQVESFSVDRLEEMVLSITKSELTMITYLGALLGGIIGLLQGFIAILLQ